MIRVVNVRGMNSPEQRAGVCYVGRRCAGWPGHSLGNPFRVRQSDRNQDRGSVARTAADALARYQAWVAGHPMRDALLAALWAECDHGRKPLGCWCTTATHGDGRPVVCHAQILAELLAERFTREVV